MDEMLSLLNGTFVSLFGGLLSASFCDALHTKKDRLTFLCGMALTLLMQGCVYILLGAEIMRRSYPLTMHLPLLLMLCVMTKRFLSPLVSIMTAYLCCQLRRWLALLMVALLSGSTAMQDGFELIVTLPLLLLLLYYVSPVMRKTGTYTVKIQLQIGILPMIYYAFDYLACVYTDLLLSGSALAVEFMSFVCCAAYIIFLLYNFFTERNRNDMAQMQKVLNIQLTQAVHEIESLRESQALAQRYRHDLRHHLQYLSSCLAVGQTVQAQEYISGICKEIDAQAVQRFCENETVNLILSAYAGRAEKLGVRLTAQGALPAYSLIADRDMCVLLSNALENALNACKEMPQDAFPEIQVEFHQSSRMYLQIVNPCCSQVHFEKGLPVAHSPDHGQGVQSICAVVRRYNGICSFKVQDGQFIFRMSI